MKENRLLLRTYIYNKYIVLTVELPFPLVDVFSGKSLRKYKYETMVFDTSCKPLYNFGIIRCLTEDEAIKNHIYTIKDLRKNLITK